MDIHRIPGFSSSKLSIPIKSRAMPCQFHVIVFFKSINVILFKMHLDNGNDNDNDNEKRDVGMAEQFSGMVYSLKHTPS